MKQFITGLTLPDGNAGAPVFSFSGDTNTGLYRITSDTLGFATAGIEWMRLSDIGLCSIGTVNSTSRLNIGGEFTRTAWGVVGPILNTEAITVTDSNTAASGTVANAMFNVLAQPTFASTNGTIGNLVTATNSATLYIPGAPLAVTNNTAITNSWALFIDAGNVRIDGSLRLPASGSSTAPEYSFNGVSDYGMYQATSGLRWAISGAEIMALTSTGLGVGQSTPTARLDVISVDSAGSAAFYGIRNTYTRTLGTDVTNNSWGMYNLSSVGGAGSFTQLIGFNNHTIVSSTGVTNTGKALVSTIATGGSAGAVALSSLAASFSGGGSGTITNYYGLAVGDVANASTFTNTFSTITNTYGIYVGDITTGTQTNTPYSIYVSDTSSYAYMGAALGVGTATTPLNKFHVKTTNSNENLALVETSASGSTTSSWLAFKNGGTTGGTGAYPRLGCYGTNVLKLESTAGDIELALMDNNASALRTRVAGGTNDVFYIDTTTSAKQIVLGLNDNSTKVRIRYYLQNDGGYVNNVDVKSAAYTVTVEDYMIECNAASAAFTVTLPASPLTGQTYIISKIDAIVANLVTIGLNGKNVNGSSTNPTLSTQYEGYRLIYTGSEWRLIGTF